MQQNIIDSGAVSLHPPKKSEDYEVIPLTDTDSQDPNKPGPKPKKLKAIEVQGFEVGRGLRKRVVVPEDVYKLAALGCTDKEIALWFDIAYDTLRYNFADIIEKGRQDLKTALRKAMLQNALNGNAALQIFMAKNMLGMSDNPTNSDDRKPLPWSDN